MHQLLPFHGVARVAYLPGERIVGLSTLALLGLLRDDPRPRQELLSLVKA